MVEFLKKLCNYLKSSKQKPSRRWFNTANVTST